MADINDILTGHHRTLDDLLEAWHIRRSRNLQQARAFFEEFADQLVQHIDMEEDLLFPKYDSYFSTAHTVTPQLIRQHRQLVDQLEELRSRTSECNEEQGTLIARFQRLLDVHNATEEYAVYPLLEEILDAGDRAQVAALFNGCNIGN